MPHITVKDCQYQSTALLFLQFQNTEQRMWCGMIPYAGMLLGHALKGTILGENVAVNVLNQHQRVIGCSVDIRLLQ